MSDTVVSLLQRATECEQKAALTADEKQRRRFHELAEAWRGMAADYEQLSRQRGQTTAT